MQLTPNYNLKKPEETDPIDILDLNDNADIIDAEFKKRPVASGGDVSEMTVKTLETTTTEFPVPVAGESTKTFLGKVKKFFEDTKNWMTGVCLIGQIVNNCVTNNAKLPLSAAQGKVLMDLYTVLNTKIINLNVRHNATSDRIQVLRNGDWIDALLTGYIWLFEETVGLQNGASANPISSIFTNTFDNDAIYAPLCKFKNETSIFISKYGFEVAGIVGKRIIIEWSVTNAEAFSKIYVAIARNDGVNNNTNFYNSTEPITANTRYMIEIDLSPIMGFSSTYPNMQIQYENSRAVSGTFKVHNIYLVR